MSKQGIINIHGKEYIAPNGCEYLVSDEGEIYRKVRSAKNAKTGYRHTDLGRNNTVHIHRLVCELFHGPAPFDGAVVIHLDEDKRNNHANNLKWGTQSENMKRAYGSWVEA